MMTLKKVGLLPKDNEQQIPFAYKLYKRQDEEGIALCAGYKRTFCRSVIIEFVGVWYVYPRGMRECCRAIIGIRSRAWVFW